MDASSLAMRVFREAVRRGFPYGFRRVSASVVSVWNSRGRGSVYVRLVEDKLVAASDPYSPWHVPLARLVNGELVDLAPWNAPRAIAHNDHIISSFEVDVWSTRLRLVERLVWVDRWPSRLEPYRLLGARLGFLPETMDYAVVLPDGTVVAWYNEVTGRLDDATPYLTAMGLLAR